MIRVKVRGDIKQIQRKMQAMPKKMTPAVVSALNRTLAQMNTRARREISQDVGIPQKHISVRLKTEKANFSTPRATLIALTVGIPYIRLAKSKWRHIKGAFVQTMPKSGHVGVFKRQGTSRLPIDEQRLEIEPAAKKSLTTMMASFAPAKFRERLAHEIKRRLR